MLDTDMDYQQLIDNGYTEGKKSFAFLWEKLERNFDWGKVYKVMKALDWHWHIHDENYGIPRVDTLKKRAREIAFEVYERGQGQSMTGGFTIGWDSGEMYIVFTVEECTTGDC